MRRINVFGYNTENDEKIPEGANGDLYCDGKEFIVGEVSDEHRAKVDELEGKAEKMKDKSDSVLPARYLAYIPALLGVIAAVVSTKLEPPVSIVLLTVGIAFFAVYVLMYRRINAKRRELSMQDRSMLYPPLFEAIKELNAAEKELLAGYGFSDNCVKTDVFHPIYDSEEEYQAYANLKGETICLPVFMERVGDTFKLSDLYINFDIPVSSLKEIVRINRGGSFLKLVGEYSIPAVLPKGVTVKRDEYVTTVEYDHHYAISIENGGKEYEITFPPYELDRVVYATSLSVNEQLL